MKNKLQRYFPIIRTRKEILNELRDNDELWSQFESWEEENQEEYLDICTGVKGVKVLYDTFFKAVMNPDLGVSIHGSSSKNTTCLVPSSISSRCFSNR